MTQATDNKNKSPKDNDKAWFKIYREGTGPIINGSELRNTSSTSRKAFNEPESRP